jgi:hypothetical protein
MTANPTDTAGGSNCAATMREQGYGRKAIRAALRRELRAIGRETLERESP